MTESSSPQPLPDRPNLDQLRKQAKELHSTEKFSTLAGAQQAIARRYGFASWPKLKLAVESQQLRRLIKECDAKGVTQLLRTSPRAARGEDTPNSRSFLRDMRSSEEQNRSARFPWYWRFVCRENRAIERGGLHLVESSLATRLHAWETDRSFLIKSANLSQTGHQDQKEGIVTSESDSRLTRIENLLQALTERQVQQQVEILQLQESQKKTDQQIQQTDRHVETLVSVVGRVADSQERTEERLYSLIETVDRLASKVDKLTDRIG
jgi:hypothetical protein